MFDCIHTETVEDGLRCRSFRPQGEREVAAAIYDRPDTPDEHRTPLVLVQHGGSSSKTGADIKDAAQAFAAGLGWRVIALDGPVHGARIPVGQPDEARANRDRFFGLWQQAPEHVDAHVARWQSLVDEISTLRPEAPLLWFGPSMGTAYGLPLLAVEPRIRRAVLGMWGTSFVNSARLRDDASAVKCPVLFQQKWDDELFTREGQLALFDALGSTDKRLQVFTGGHVRVAGEQLAQAVAFLASRRPSG